MSGWRERATPATGGWRERAQPAEGWTVRDDGVRTKTVTQSGPSVATDTNVFRDPNAPDRTDWLAALSAAGDMTDLGKRARALTDALKGRVDTYDPMTGESKALDMSNQPLSERLKYYDQNLRAVRSLSAVAQEEHPNWAMVGSAAPYTVMPEMGLMGRLATWGTIGALKSESSPVSNTGQFLGDIGKEMALGEGGRLAGKAIGGTVNGVANGFNRFNQSIVGRSGLPGVIPGDFVARMSAPAGQNVAEAAAPVAAGVASGGARIALEPAANAAQGALPEKGNLKTVFDLLNRGRKGDFNGMNEEAENFVLRKGPAIQDAAKKIGLDIGDSTPADWVHRDFDITKQMSTQIRNKGRAGIAENLIVNDPEYARVRSGPDKIKLVERMRDESGAKVSEFAKVFDQTTGAKFDPTTAAQRIQEEVLAPLEKHGTQLDRPAIRVVRDQIKALARSGNNMSFEDAFERIRHLDPHLNWDSKADSATKSALKQVRGILNREAETAAESAAQEVGNPEAFAKWKEAKTAYGALKDFAEHAAARLGDARTSNRAVSLTDYLAGGSGVAAIGGGLASGRPMAALAGVAGVGGAVANKWARERGPQMMALSLMRNAATPGAVAPVLGSWEHAPAVRAAFARGGATSGLTLADLLRAQQATPATRPLRDLMGEP